MKKFKFSLSKTTKKQYLPFLAAIAIAMAGGKRNFI